VTFGYKTNIKTTKIDPVLTGTTNYTFREQGAKKDVVLKRKDVN
jgi:hypothetical protein